MGVLHEKAWSGIPDELRAVIITEARERTERRVLTLIADEMHELRMDRRTEAIA